METFDLAVSHAEGDLVLHCDVHVPQGRSRGTLLIVHGFKGYKDYGMFPFLAQQAAEVGFTAIRFNLAHSGMTRSIESFQRPDLFERDTWNRQVHDLETLVAAVRSGEVPGADPDAPIALFGHSRGGVASILMAGRGGAVDLVVSAAAPSEIQRTSTLAEQQLQELEDSGVIETESARTGQVLRIGRAFLDEVDADPAAHDVPELAGRMRCPLVVIHGSEDPTVECAHAHVLAERAGTTACIVDGGNHVFNVANPFPADEAPSPQLAELSARMCEALETSLKKG